ncbi:MAG: hypothetical protein IJO52_08300 [Clostridia bacterium]|nr:hypothetical protein [Clostridia bacterium]
MEEKIKKFKRIYNLSLITSGFLYIAALIIISFVSEQLDRGGFFEFDFPFYLLIFTLMTAPFAVLIFGAALIVKEIILYKKFKMKKRSKFILLTIAYSLIILIGIFAFSGLAFNIIDIMLMVITVLAITSAVLMVIAYKKK